MRSINSARTAYIMSAKIKICISLMLVLCLSCAGALACTAIYVGSGLTAGGDTLLARSEDISNSYNKLFYKSPAGKHVAGEVYDGCYGFTYTFTKDSYAYTAFSDDNGDAVAGECPDCGGTHAHTPYEAGGTNEMGVTVSATETIGCSDAVYEADPYEDLGIEEAEITTVLLGESASAKEAVELLAGIYDDAGCCGGSGILIADDSETWYVENATGHQYIALKLSDSMAFAQPNMSIIGLIDLDDSENVVASEGLIEVAKQAGTYVGDEEANTIDYVASYNGDQEVNERMVNALKYFNAETASEEPVPADYTISNVDAEGNIVPMHTGIAPDHAFTVKDVIGYYHISGIGSNRNLETHIFQIAAEDSLTDTVEWIAMDDACYSVFVPYFPMLTTDTYAGYQLSTLPSEFTEEPNADAEISYATTKYKRDESGERVAVEGYVALPENWADSMYWTFDALSNLIEAGNADEAQLAEINAKLEALQQDCYAAYDDLTVAASDAETEADAAQAATEISSAAAASVHAAAVELVNAIH